MKLKDMDKVEAWTGGILPVGPHIVTIEKVEEGKSSGGHDQLELEFVATDGQGSIRDWLVVIPSTYGKVKQLLDACGIDTESGDWDFKPDTLRDKTLGIRVGEEPDRQDATKMRKRVLAYIPADDAAKTDVPASNNDDLPF